MARLLIALVLLTIVVLAITALSALLRPAHAAASGALEKGLQMPGSFQTIAYILLIVLMIGVASGFVGSL